MKRRKKKELDGIDREILRALYKRECLVSSAIANYVGMSSSAIFPRLENLKERGIIKQAKVSGSRVYFRNFNGKKTKIKSARSIYWKIDFRKK